MFGWPIVVVLAFGGFAGGYLIRRYQSGRQTGLVWLLWLVLPFLALFVLLVSQIDPALPAERAQYNLAFGFVLVAILVAVIWFPANLAGSMIARRAMPATRAPVKPSAPATAPPPLSASDMPDWSKPDRPLLEEWQLAPMMRDVAARMSVDPARLPRFGRPGQEEGTFVFRDKFEYVYVAMAGGRPEFEFTTSVADRLLYQVFADISFGVVYAALDPKVRAQGGYDATVSRGRIEILSRADPRWGRYLAATLKQPPQL